MSDHTPDIDRELDRVAAQYRRAKRDGNTDRCAALARRYRDELAHMHSARDFARQVKAREEAARMARVKRAKLAAHRDVWGF